MVDFKKMLSPIQDTGDYVEWANTLDSAGKDSGPARQCIKTGSSIGAIKAMILSVIQTGAIADRIKKRVFYQKESAIADEVMQFTRSGERQEAVARFDDHKTILLFHAILGLVTEAAELMETLGRYIYDGVPIDEQNIKEELGDSSWYHALGARWLGYDSFMPILQANYRKLIKRYPEGIWTRKDAINRNTEAEMEALDGVKDWNDPTTTIPLADILDLRDSMSKSSGTVFNSLQEIVEQFELVQYEDPIGHKLTNNAAFVSLKAMVAMQKPVIVKKNGPGEYDRGWNTCLDSISEVE